MSQPKREVPPVLKAILQKDVEVTKKLVIMASRKMNLAKCKTYFKGLEISCHGIPWFAFWIGFTWLFNDPSLIQMQVNILLGLLLDIVFVALLKAFTRRRRPVKNTDDALGQVGPDVFSFPSGHASRAVFVVYFFLNLHPAPIIFAPLLIVWATAVCISRLLMHRHHLLDVIAGVFLGLFVGILMGFLYVEDSTARWMMNYLSDEKLDGGEYHV
ncbi:PREDICTED: phospholipid phosphatase 6 [Nicrophorus vespilloides]|uniref:Phospholipid phosphatase 6 n=1 Tax=Nicrophorus vespilloides TaxID=110193 RepID=A0ABM1NJ53_NICVS|nr:PREDICTED: phospholipid phosphatase 6 [Nicrophorus vespilloides]